MQPPRFLVSVLFQASDFTESPFKGKTARIAYAAESMIGISTASTGEATTMLRCLIVAYGSSLLVGMGGSNMGPA